MVRSGKILIPQIDRFMAYLPKTDIPTVYITARTNRVLRPGTTTDHSTVQPAVEKRSRFDMRTADIVSTDDITADDATEIGAADQ